MQRVYVDRKMFNSISVGELIQALKNFDENSPVMLKCEVGGTDVDCVYADIDYVECDGKDCTVYICGQG